MSFLQDINGSIVNGFVPSKEVGFRVPLLLGITGERFILAVGSGVNGIVFKSVGRDAGFNIQIIVTGSSYTYTKSGNNIVITVPTSHTIRALIADFAVNGSSGDNVAASISMVAATTGSGTLSAMASTAMAGLTEYANIQNIIQLQYYYDSTDPEYIMINNMLGGSETHITNLFLLDLKETLDIYGVPTQSSLDLITANDNGDWYAACVASTAVAVVSALNNYFSTKTRLFFAVTSDVADLASVQGRIVYEVHPTGQKAQHPEASWMAKGLVPFPGASKWKDIINLQGQTPDITTSYSGLLAIRAANGNAYVTANGNNFMQDGRVNQVGASNSNPLYIDQLMLRDWILLTCISRLDSLQKSLVAIGQKLSYDNDGINKVRSTIAGVLQTAADNKAIAAVAPGNTAQAGASYNGKFRYNVNTPTRASVEANNPNDIVQRILNNTTFWYIPSGAIDAITFSGSELITEPAA